MDQETFNKKMDALDKLNPQPLRDLLHRAAIKETEGWVSAQYLSARSIGRGGHDLHEGLDKAEKRAREAINALAVMSAAAPQVVADNRRPTLAESGALRQYLHNDSTDANENFVFAYDKDITDCYIASLYLAAAPVQAQEPVAHLKFWAAQSWSGNGNHDIDCGEGLEVCEAGEIGADKLAAFPVYRFPVQEKEPRPELTVWYGPMPESNGKSNFTATLKRKDAHPFDTNSYTFQRSEYPERVRYEADCMRYLIGEIDTKPDILAYDADKHSGYVAPMQPMAVPDGWKLVPSKSPTEAMLQIDDYPRIEYRQYLEMLAAAPAAPAAQGDAKELTDEQINAIWMEADQPCEANDWTTGPVPFARAIIAAIAAKAAS